MCTSLALTCPITFPLFSRGAKKWSVRCSPTLFWSLQEIGFLIKDKCLAANCFTVGQSLATLFSFIFPLLIILSNLVTKLCALLSDWNCSGHFLLLIKHIDSLHRSSTVWFRPDGFFFFFFFKTLFFPSILAWRLISLLTHTSNCFSPRLKIHGFYTPWFIDKFN